MSGKSKGTRRWFRTAILLTIAGVNSAAPASSGAPDNVARKITISTRDSLRLAKGAYVSILFTAKSGARSKLPIQYSFSQSGDPPPGMVFESYPCHKVGQSVCPELASSDGVYLDGVPSAAGSYRLTIAATGPGGSQGSRAFIVIVESK